MLCPRRYVGELISDAEADVREDDSYLFDLDNKVSRHEQCSEDDACVKRDGFLTHILFPILYLFKGRGSVLHRRPLLWQHQSLHQPPLWPKPHPGARVHAAPGPEVPTHRLFQLQGHPQRSRTGVRRQHLPQFIFITVQCENFCLECLPRVNSPCPHPFSSGSTTEIAFGTLRASISPASADLKNASTLPRPSPWSKAGWRGWKLVQNQEQTAGWACWEAPEAFAKRGLEMNRIHFHF